MKIASIGTIALIAWILVYGSPFTDGQPERGYHYSSPERILPMTFAHADHTAVGCIDCHHNYVDDTGRDPCMFCHVTDADVSPLLEQQFHSLCRGCHAELAGQGEAGGPPRQCIACHLADHSF